MNKTLASKPNLSDGWIDACTGEAHLVRQALVNNFDLSSIKLSLTEENSSYPESAGIKKLTSLLEDKHGSPVVICNGAKQALAGAFHAIRRKNKTKLGMRAPYWALIPPLAAECGLETITKSKYDAYLGILPNNPDGFLLDNDYCKYLADYHADLDIPFIHDAVYYTPAYIKNLDAFIPFGDVQIYSISKMFGLSGLRVGYAVCHNHSYYDLVKNYVEMTTVGVSQLSQLYCLELFNLVNSCKEKLGNFYKEVNDGLDRAKSLLKSVNTDVLSSDSDLDSSAGMFAWMKIGAKCDFAKHKIYVVNGEPFGDASMVRLNMALPYDQLKLVVDRLNNV